MLRDTAAVGWLTKGVPLETVSILLGHSSKGLESLKWMESRAIAEMISQEHPQIIALVLAHLDPDQAAEVIGYLPPRVRSDAAPIRLAGVMGAICMPCDSAKHSRNA